MIKLINFYYSATKHKVVLTNIWGMKRAVQDPIVQAAAEPKKKHARHSEDKIEPALTKEDERLMERIKKDYKKYGITKDDGRLERLHRLATQKLAEARQHVQDQKDIKQYAKPSWEVSRKFYLEIYPEQAVNFSEGADNRVYEDPRVALLAEKWKGYATIRKESCLEHANGEFWDWHYDSIPREKYQRPLAGQSTMWDDMLKHKRFESYTNAHLAFVKAGKEMDMWYVLVSRCEKAEIVAAASTFKISHRALSAIEHLINKSDAPLREHARGKHSEEDGCRFLRIAIFTDDGKVLQKFHIQRDTGKGYRKNTVTDIDGAFLLTSKCSKTTFKTLGVIDPKRRVCTIKVDKDGAATKFEHAIEEFSQDPKEFLANVGKKMGECCMCGRPLSDEESKGRGFGPICYKWIQDNKKFIAAMEVSPKKHASKEEKKKEVDNSDAEAEAELGREDFLAAKADLDKGV
jgi:hypothetical protein